MTFYVVDNHRKGVRLEDLPPEAWTYVTGGPKTGLDKLYSTVSWLYRCVDIRANAVASMPFEIKRGQDTVLAFDGLTYDEDFPPDLLWLNRMSPMLKKTEAAAVLGGRAYWERRLNLLGRPLQYEWLLPSTIEPQITSEGLTGWKRRVNGKTITLDPEVVVHFWPPDYGVEIGPSTSYPGKAVMVNAGVIGSMDLFLSGYFERGMVKATLLKYKDTITAEEARRVKEWWRRVFQGVKNAFSTQVVRGDFETMTIGEGIADLRDNALTDKERESIAAGLGVPQSKVAANAANFATKQSDDVMFIEDTIIPEIQWIYAALNDQVFKPMGYRIIAKPEQLRVMQHDETQRSAAFANYVNAGLPLEAVVEMLGLDLPKDVEFGGVAMPEDGTATPASIDEIALAAANREAGGEVDKVMLNGAQIQSALAIVDKVATGAVDQQTAINMLQAFLGISPNVGRQLVPSGQTVVPGEQFSRTMTLISIQDKREERDQLLRWLDKRGAQADLNEFKTKHLDRDEVESIFYNWVEHIEMDRMIDQWAEAMNG